MEIFLHPPWPIERNLEPAALFRIPKEELERRLGFKFAVFLDENIETTGFAGKTDKGRAFAVGFKPERDVSMSLYLSIENQVSASALLDVLEAIRVLPDEILFGQLKEFSIQDIADGKHSLR